MGQCRNSLDFCALGHSPCELRSAVSVEVEGCGCARAGVVVRVCGVELCLAETTDIEFPTQPDQT